eukprot:scaffold3740_cov322-Prasinococcus_capsulatus_cf.AAC.14
MARRAMRATSPGPPPASPTHATSTSAIRPRARWRHAVSGTAADGDGGERRNCGSLPLTTRTVHGGCRADEVAEVPPELEAQLQQARAEAAETCKDGNPTDCAVAWEEVRAASSAGLST